MNVFHHVGHDSLRMIECQRVRRSLGLTSGRARTSRAERGGTPVTLPRGPPSPSPVSFHRTPVPWSTRRVMAPAPPTPLREGFDHCPDGLETIRRLAECPRATVDGAWQTTLPDEVGFLPARELNLRVYARHVAARPPRDRPPRLCRRGTHTLPAAPSPVSAPAVGGSTTRQTAAAATRSRLDESCARAAAVPRRRH